MHFVVLNIFGNAKADAIALISTSVHPFNTECIVQSAISAGVCTHLHFGVITSATGTGLVVLPPVPPEAATVGFGNVFSFDAFCVLHGSLLQASMGNKKCARMIVRTLHMLCLSRWRLLFPQVLERYNELRQEYGAVAQKISEIEMDRCVVGCMCSALAPLPPALDVFLPSFFVQSGEILECIF